MRVEKVIHNSYYSTDMLFIGHTSY